MANNCCHSAHAAKQNTSNSSYISTAATGLDIKYIRNEKLTCSCKQWAYICAMKLRILFFTLTQELPQGALGAWLMQDLFAIKLVSTGKPHHRHVVAVQQTTRRSSRNVLLEITALAVYHMYFIAWWSICNCWDINIANQLLEFKINGFLDHLTVQKVESQKQQDASMNLCDTCEL